MKTRRAALAALILALGASPAAGECGRRLTTYAGSSVNWICLSTDVLPENVSVGDGVVLVDETNMATADTAGWWRKGRTYSNATRGDYEDRQRPRVTITAPTGAGRMVDGSAAVTLAADVGVPNDANDAIADTAINTYAWVASPAVGVFASAAAQDTTWTAPAATAAAQVVTLTLTATETYTTAEGGDISGSGSVTVTVAAS